MHWHEVRHVDGNWRATLVIVPDLATMAEGQHYLREDLRESRFLLRPRSRAIWLASRLALRLILAEWLDQDPVNLLLARHCAACNSKTHGKPYLPELPSHHFNLSHSGSSLAVALSNTYPIGVDIEMGDVDQAALEPLRLHHFPDASPLHRWIRTEAALKAQGWGLDTLGQDRATEDHLHSATPSIVVELPQMPVALAWAIQPLPVPKIDERIALCT